MEALTMEAAIGKGTAIRILQDVLAYADIDKEEAENIESMFEDAVWAADCYED